MQNGDQGLLDFSGDAGVVFFDVDVDFAAHAKILEINSGLNGKAGGGNDLPIIAGLKIVHVGAVAVDVLADGMSVAVDEKIAVALALDDVSRRVIHLVAVDDSALAHRPLHETDGRVARLSYHSEDFNGPFGDRIKGNPARNLLLKSVRC